MVRDPETLARDLELFRRLAGEAGTVPGPVTAMAPLPIGEPSPARRLIERYRELGVERLVCPIRYQEFDEYRDQLEKLARLAAVGDRS